MLADGSSISQVLFQHLLPSTLSHTQCSRKQALRCDLSIDDSLGSDLDGMKEADWLEVEVNLHVGANKDLSQSHGEFWSQEGVQRQPTLRQENQILK